MKTLRYYPARPLSPEESTIVEGALRELDRGRLQRFSIGLEHRVGKKWYPGGGCCIDARSEDEARACAQTWYGDKVDAHRRIEVRLCDVLSGYGDWFRPAGIGPAIDLVPREERWPGTHQWLSRHRGRDPGQLTLALGV